MSNATITNLTLATDGVILVTADCDRCQRTVLHGAGTNLDDLNLGHRMAHCRCPGGYELADTNDVVRLRVRVLRKELAERVAAEEARRAAHAARRAAAAQLREAIQQQGAR
jgi:hypothetical protein